MQPSNDTCNRFTSTRRFRSIDEAIATVGSAVFTNALGEQESTFMHTWFEDMKRFFELPLETKKQYPYEGDTNLGYSIMGAENVDPRSQKTLHESI